MKQIRLSVKYDKKFSHSWAYSLYSALLAELEEEFADEIHDNMFFSQYLTKDEWIINTEKDLKFKDIYVLTKHQITIEVKVISVTEIIEDSFVQKYLMSGNYNKKITINFLTPTTFKQDGEFVLFPTKNLIMQSLTNKWNIWAKKFIIEDPDWTKCKISYYNLKLQNYEIKGAKINGFTGIVELTFWDSESVVRLANLLCYFANYAGIGVKVRLGMGGVNIE